MRRTGYSFIIFLIFYVLTSGTSYSNMNNYCAKPPFVSSGVKPNVLIILDNSNSMDEDFYGNAVTSYATASKMVQAKKAIKQLIRAYKEKLRIGLETFRIGSSVNDRYLHNSQYFVSYEPKSYCPNPPEECVEYCATGNVTKKNICSGSCTAQNSLFDVDYFDEIITNYSVNSTERRKYCSLVYPKTLRIQNPADPSHYIYYKMALPFYSSGNEGTGFCYADPYDPNEGVIVNNNVWDSGSGPWDYYRCYNNKTGTSDAFTGYSSSKFNARFAPTDSDIALGYFDFGRRLTWYYVGKTWFKNTSPGDGYIHVAVDDLVDSLGNNTTTFNNLISKLDEKENDQAGYMSCTTSTKDNCSYIISAGLTPTPGSFQTAIDYFQGSSSPIGYSCQKNFVVFVTDGLPSVDETGATKTADELNATTLSKIDTLRSLVKNISGTNYTFDIKTYVLGVGLGEQAREKLDYMAIHGGTDVNGHAYYANNATALFNALDQIFVDVLKKASTGSSVSILAARAKKGSITNQAVFYPEKRFLGGESVEWPGYLYAYWFLAKKSIQNLREDTNQNKYLDILEDYIIKFDIDNVTGELIINAYDSALNGTMTTLHTTYETLDDVHPIWEAGERLLNTDSDTRTIYYAGSSSNGTLYELNATNLSANVSGIQHLFGNDTAEYPSCLGGNLTAKMQNLINYVRGESVSGCRSRNTGSGIWKLGDIIYSTPTIEDYGDMSLIFTGANDGMLHAFREGTIRTDGLSSEQVVRICDNMDSNCTVSQLGAEEWAFIPKHVLPYLRYLADPDYGKCHIYFVDLSPYLIREDTDDDGYIDKRILIGGMRLGGGCGCTSTDCINPPSDTCPDPSDNETCVGLSSYFALDVSDPDNPQYLWDFSDPDLGFSYSGPAYIKTHDKKYVMFLSGPTDYNGSAGQDLKIFVLELDDSFKVASTYTIDSSVSPTLSSFSDSFGGRLFTNGIDYDDNGTTDAVFFGVNNKNGTTWQGNLLLIRPNDGDPTTWDVEKVFNSAIEPITAKVEYMKCFDMNFIYFGTGRWFFKTDEEGQNINDVEKLYGVRIDDCLLNENCNLNAAHNSSDMCSELESDNLAAWKVDMLEPKDSDYFKERTITDPTPSDYNLIFFTTTQPSADLCKFGGRSRLWALNCATGGNITSSCPNDQYLIKNYGGTLLLQLSRGNIYDIGVKEESFTQEGGRATEWMTGIPPESSTPLAGLPPGTEGEIILWMEK